MIKRLSILAALAACLALPSLASAHTGSVSCVGSNVQFVYNSNFANSTVVTENVNGTTKTFTVPAHTAVTDTIPAPSGSVIAGASWSDGTAAGSIPFVALTCAFTPPPANVCTPTTVTVPGPATVEYITGPGATEYVTKTKVVYRTRIKWRTRIKLVRFHEVKPVHGVLDSGGVTG